ncbi:MAG: GAF domain-containing protein [Anaerolineae bacterium]|nr:GAF domain-containing protein [Anaerolineae bacterium]
MTAPLAFTFVFIWLALIVTLGTIMLLGFCRYWRTRENVAVLQFLVSLVILQTGTIFLHIGLLADLPDFLIKYSLNVLLIGFSLVTLSELSVVLHIAANMKDAWQIALRAGIAALLVFQPALWQHDFLTLTPPLDHNLLGSPYTHLGKTAAIINACYVGLTLVAAWRYWRRIDSPLLTGTLIGIAVIQGGSLISGFVRTYSLVAITGGFASSLLGCQIIRELRTSPGVWLRDWTAISQTITRRQPLDTMLADIAHHMRGLMQADVVSVLLVHEPHQLKVIAMAGPGPSIVGRQMRMGEGLAGRVMQTGQSMRIDSYQSWNGRAAGFEDVPFYASMSTPLIFRERVVGVINAHQTRPGRIFSEQDQTILELLAPQAAIAIAQAELENALSTPDTFTIS